MGVTMLGVGRKRKRKQLVEGIKRGRRTIRTTGRWNTFTRTIRTHGHTLAAITVFHGRKETGGGGVKAQALS